MVTVAVVVVVVMEDRGRGRGRNEGRREKRRQVITRACQWMACQARLAVAVISECCIGRHPQMTSGCVVLDHARSPFPSLSEVYNPPLFVS